jgi:hypothetical protein
MKGNEVIENADIVVTNNGHGIGSAARRSRAARTTIDVAGRRSRPASWIHTRIFEWRRTSTATCVELRGESRVRRDETARDPQTGATDVCRLERRGVGGQHSRAAHLLDRARSILIFGVRDLESARRVLKRYADYYDTKTIKQYRGGQSRGPAVGDPGGQRCT